METQRELFVQGASTDLICIKLPLNFEGFKACDSNLAELFTGFAALASHPVDDPPSEKHVQ